MPNTLLDKALKTVYSWRFAVICAALLGLVGGGLLVAHVTSLVRDIGNYSTEISLCIVAALILWSLGGVGLALFYFANKKYAPKETNFDEEEAEKCTPSLGKKNETETILDSSRSLSDDEIPHVPSIYLIRPSIPDGRLPTQRAGEIKPMSRLDEDIHKEPDEDSLDHDLEDKMASMRKNMSQMGLRRLV